MQSVLMGLSLLILGDSHFGMQNYLITTLQEEYILVARAKGMSEFELLLRYPVRLALNPLISTIGWILPAVISGEIIVSVVMSLPTTGPLLLRSLLAQDMYLAGSLILLISVLTIIGTLISDILLAITALPNYLLLTTTSERQGRLIDTDSAGSMERKKQEGYF